MLGNQIQGPSVPWVDRSHTTAAVISPNLDNMQTWFRNDQGHEVPGAMPGLREVHLEPCYVYWASPIFNRLTKLSLNFVLNDVMECWNGLLLILSQSPCLRGLCLKNIPAYFDGELIITQKMAKVSLPYLEELTLSNPTPWMVALLAQLEFPRSTFIQLGCDFYDPNKIPLLIPFITDKFGSRLSQSTASIEPAL